MEFSMCTKYFYIHIVGNGTTEYTPVRTATLSEAVASLDDTTGEGKKHGWSSNNSASMLGCLPSQRRVCESWHTCFFSPLTLAFSTLKFISGGSLLFTWMHFRVMRPLNSRVPLKWLEEEYVAALLLLLFGIFCFFVVGFMQFSTLWLESILKILADSMGLGKTIMTIALLLSHSERGGSSGSQPTSQLSGENGEASNILGQSTTFAKKSAKFSSLDKLLKHKPTLISGGNLIICPMTLLGQWKVLQICFSWQH